MGRSLDVSLQIESLELVEYCAVSDVNLCEYDGKHYKVEERF